MRTQFLVGCALFFAGASADAAYIRYDVAGAITEVRSYNGEPASIVQGARWTGTLWVDADQPDSKSHPNVAYYSAGSFGSVSVGPYSFDFQDGEAGVVIFDEYPSSDGPIDSLNLNWYMDRPFEERPNVDGWLLSDAFFSIGGEALAGRGVDRSLLSSLNVNGADLTNASFEIHFSKFVPFAGYLTSYVIGTVDTFSATVVPIPATAWLMVTGTFALLGRRVRVQRRAGAPGRAGSDS